MLCFKSRTSCDDTNTASLVLILLLKTIYLKCIRQHFHSIIVCSIICIYFFSSPSSVDASVSSSNNKAILRLLPFSNTSIIVEYNSLKHLYKSS